MRITHIRVQRASTGELTTPSHSLSLLRWPQILLFLLLSLLLLHVRAQISSSTASDGSPSSGETPIDEAYAPLLSNSLVRLRLVFALSSVPSDLLTQLETELLAWLTTLAQDYDATPNAPFTTNLFSYPPFFSSSVAPSAGRISVFTELTDALPSFSARRAYVRMKSDVTESSGQRRFSSMPLLSSLLSLSHLCFSGPLNGTYAATCGDEFPRETRSANSQRAYFTGATVLLCMSSVLGFFAFHRQRLLAPDHVKAAAAARWNARRLEQQQAKMRQLEEKRAASLVPLADGALASPPQKPTKRVAQLPPILASLAGDATVLSQEGNLIIPMHGEEDDQMNTHSVSSSGGQQAWMAKAGAIGTNSVVNRAIARASISVVRGQPDPEAMPPLGRRLSANGGPIFQEPPSTDITPNPTRPASPNSLTGAPPSACALHHRRSNSELRAAGLLAVSNAMLTPVREEATRRVVQRDSHDTPVASPETAPARRLSGTVTRADNQVQAFGGPGAIPPPELFAPPSPIRQPPPAAPLSNLITPSSRPTSKAPTPRPSVIAVAAAPAASPPAKAAIAGRPTPRIPSGTPRPIVPITDVQAREVEFHNNSPRLSPAATPPSAPMSPPARNLPITSPPLTALPVSMPVASPTFAQASSARRSIVVRGGEEDDDE
jgi:hypothetical protein